MFMSSSNTDTRSMIYWELVLYWELLASISLKITSEHISPCSDIVVQEVFKLGFRDPQGATRGC